MVGGGAVMALVVAGVSVVTMDPGAPVVVVLAVGGAVVDELLPEQAAATTDRAMAAAMFLVLRIATRYSSL